MALKRKQLTIDGGRVRLRPVRDSDLDALVEQANDAEIARWTGLPHPYEREHAAHFIAHAGEALRLDTEYHLAIECLEDGALIGMINLREIDHEGENAEVGFWVGAERRGHGIASEAVVLVHELAFDRLDLARLYAFVLDGNKGSINLLERMGYHEEGRLRWHTRRDGRWMDKVWYGILREEWEAREQGVPESPEPTPRPKRRGRGKARAGRPNKRDD